MAKAQNRIIAGKYEGHRISYNLGKPKTAFETFFDKEHIEEYELVTAEKIKSGSSAIIRGAIGGAVLGPVGLLAAVTAKNNGINTVAIEWKDGSKSVIEVDDKIYKAIVKEMF